MKGTRRLLSGYGVILIGGLLLGFVLRVLQLDVKDMWWDEAHSWWYASLPLAVGVVSGMQAWSGAAGDPLYTILLHGWVTITGESLFALRYLSVLGSLLAVAGLGRIAGRMWGRRGAVAGVLIGATAGS